MERGCEIAFQARLRNEIEWAKKTFGHQWKGMIERGVKDYIAFMREPIRCYRFGKLSRRVKEWTQECFLR
jgi:ribonucleotide reductase beta subunit family protein with ferritin-like domain